VREGVPAGPGYTVPLYGYGVFKSTHGKTPSLSPFVAQHVDYSRVSCPVCEQAVVDTVWVYQSPLLADDDAIRSIVAAVRKVAENTKELR
jgi:hypothetical protein